MVDLLAISFLLLAKGTHVLEGWGNCVLSLGINHDMAKPVMAILLRFARNWLPQPPLQL